MQKKNEMHDIDLHLFDMTTRAHFKILDENSYMQAEGDNWKRKSECNLWSKILTAGLINDQQKSTCVL